jgi:TonB-linked SusC/RagA family outer membrane protein
VRYFASAGLHTQGGMFQEFGLPYNMSFQYNRYNYRTNLDIDVTKSTTVSFNISGNSDATGRPQNSDGAAGIMRSIYWSTPFSSPGIVDGKRVNAALDYEGANMPFLGGSGMGYWGSGTYLTNRNVLNTDLVLKQKLDFITQNLSFTVKGSYNSHFTVNKSGTAATASYTPFLGPDGTLLYKKYGENNQISYTESMNDRARRRNWYMEAALNWNRDFGDHHVSALALYNHSKDYYLETFSDIPSGYVGLVGRITYDWRNRYMIDFNAGYNGSENFHPDRRFGFFPAGSVAWNISEEGFWEPIKPVVNFMKLRASWGLVGNDKIGGSRFMYTADPYRIGNNTTHGGAAGGGDGYIFGSNKVVLPGASESSRNNPMVTWETAVKQNYGVDFVVLKERLSTSVDYYRENRTGILVRDGAAPGFLGFSVPYANLGEVDSWGWELSLRWNDRIGKDFRYNLGLNLSHNQNKVIEMKETPQNYPWMYAKGYRVDARSQAKFWRFYDEEAEALHQKQFGKPIADHNVTLLPGDPVFEDLNDDGKIGPEDSTHALGYTDDPQYVAGFNMGFNYKNWDVSLQWTGAWDVSRSIGDVFMRPFYSNSDVKTGGLLKYHLNNTWSEENPSQSAKYPRPTWARSANNYRNSTLYEVNSSYLRLKSLQIAYNFDFPFMEKIKLNTFQLALSGYNLFTFTDYIWGDPESRASGSPTYPLQRSFSLSLRVGF